MAKPFIRVQIKKGKPYASLCTPYRKNGAKFNTYENLGLVIDKENGIFKSLKRGIFHYDSINGFQDLPESKINFVPEKEKIIIIGDVYLVYCILQENGFIDLIKEIYPHSPDTLLSIIFYRLLNSKPYNTAIDWWNATYARDLFPKATLQSQRISEHLSNLGNENIHQKFFHDYLSMIYKNNICEGIIIDSTGLQNSIKLPLTEISNHNGIINNEARLIYVVDKKLKLPIYFRCVAGNIIDVSTLVDTIKELKAWNIDISYAILDAGYYSENNIKFLLNNKINFVTRMVSNRLAYKTLVKENIEEILDIKNRIYYGQRLIFAVRREFNMAGSNLYAYICFDHTQRFLEVKTICDNSYKNKKLTDDDVAEECKTAGLFILVSSLKLEVAEILPYYYERQTIEQIFDICKNNANLLPIRIHNLQSFMGHMFISYITTICYSFINKIFTNTKFCACNVFSVMHYLFAKRLNNQLIICEPNKKMNEILKIANITLPNDLISNDN